jgi:mono/diheme cytochrome c family protein
MGVRTAEKPTFLPWLALPAPRRSRPDREAGGARSNGLKLASVVLAASLAATGGACRQDMHDQPKYKPYRASDFFGDGRSVRDPIPGTVARGQLREDAYLETGKAGDKFADAFPFAVTADVMKRGQQRFEIYCTPCHDRLGSGNGMVVRRGYRRPPSLHIDRLRQAPHGYFFDVITNGFGAMPDYAAQIPVKDRWAIVAYIRALQLSQNATMADVPPSARGELTGRKP